MATENTGKRPGLFARLGRFFSDVKGELKKVVWPSKKQVVNNTFIVMVVVAIAAVAIGGVDFLLSTAVNLLFGA